MGDEQNQRDANFDMQPIQYSVLILFLAKKKQQKNIHALTFLQKEHTVPLHLDTYTSIAFWMIRFWNGHGYRVPAHCKVGINHPHFTLV